MHIFLKYEIQISFAANISSDPSKVCFAMITSCLNTNYFNYTYRSGKCCQKLHIFLYVEILCYINQSPSIFDHEPHSNRGLKNCSVFVVVVGGEESALLIWKVSNLLIMENDVILCLLKYNLCYLIGDPYVVEFSLLF